MTRVTAYCGDRLVADGEIVFAHVDQSTSADIPANIDQKNFVFELGLMSILDVGKAGNGGDQSPAGAEATTPAEE